jgi:hypothetical protein
MINVKTVVPILIPCSASLTARTGFPPADSGASASVLRDTSSVPQRR